MKQLDRRRRESAFASTAGEPPPGSALAMLVEAQTRFALDLLACLPAGRTTFVSPWSVYQVLLMAYLAAQGYTRAELAQALGLDVGADTRLRANAALVSRLAGDGNRGYCRLRSASALFANDRVRVTRRYQSQVAAAVAGAMVGTADWARPEAVVAAANQWVSSQTDGHVSAVLDAGSIDALTSLVAVNAVYFRAPWRYPFSPQATLPAPFTLLTGQTVAVPTMQQELMTEYAVGPDWQAAWLPYDGSPFSAVIIMPDVGRLAPFAAGLDTAQLAAVRAGARQVQLRIHLPRFDAAVGSDLREPLRAMGVRRLFELADLSGIGVDPRGPMLVSRLAHQALVKVDEAGSEAAAATAVEAVSGSAEQPHLVEMRVDRPFIFLITDRMTGTILFAGRILDPRG